MTTAIQPCRKIDCCPPNDLAYSIVNGQVYTNPESSFVYDCPPGFVCQPGIYPKTVIIPETPWQPPPHDPSKPQILSLPCCSGLIVETLPIGSTQADYDAAIASMLAAFAQAEADCKNAQEPNRPAGFIVWNDQQSTSCLPEEGTLVVNWGGFPYNIYYDGVGLVMPAHVFGASTLTQPDAKASANAAAFTALMQVWNAAIASGQIECQSNDWIKYAPCVGSGDACAVCDDPDLNVFTLSSTHCVIDLTHYCDIDPDCGEAPDGTGWYWFCLYKQIGPYAVNKSLALTCVWVMRNALMAGQFQANLPTTIAQPCFGLDWEEFSVRDTPVLGTNMIQYSQLFGGGFTFADDVIANSTDLAQYNLLAGNTCYVYFVGIIQKNPGLLAPQASFDITLAIT